MIQLIVNPGARWYPGERHSPEAAARNIEALATDIRAGGCDQVEVELLLQPSEREAALLMGGTKYQAEHDGRYPFRMRINGYRHVVEMPGLPLEEVRCSAEQNILDFPRIFVSGSSWIWYIGVRRLIDTVEDYE